MTYQEIASQIVRLPLDQRLQLLEMLTHSLRSDLAGLAEPSNGDAPKLTRGMLKPEGPMPTDEELDEAYVDHLIEKYL